MNLRRYSADGIRGSAQRLDPSRSLKFGVVQTTSIMRTLQMGERPTKLAQAVAALGRIDNTIHALTYIDDEANHRRILNQLHKGESQTGSRGVSW
jgi:TnpA family transposase